MNPKVHTIQILFINSLQQDVIRSLQVLENASLTTKYIIAGSEQHYKQLLTDYSPHIVIAGCSQISSVNLLCLETALKTRPNIPFIFMTDQGNEGKALEGLAAGASDYILKEHLGRLPFAVAQAIEKYNIINQSKNAEEKLKKEEAIYKYIFETSNNAVFLIRNRKFELANEQFQQMFEYTLKDIQKSDFSVLQLATPEFRHEMESIIAEMTKSKHIRKKFEFTALTKSGNRKKVDAWITHNVIHGDAITQGIIRDVTHEKFIEQSLRDSESKFKSIFQNHSAVKLIVDPDTGAILGANEAAAKYYGWSVQELEKMNVSEINFLPPEEVAKKMTVVPQQTFTELRHLNAKGEVVDVEIFSSQVDFNGKNVLHFIIHDISAKKRAEQRIQLLNHAVEQNPGAIVITDSEGIIEYINPEFTNMTGFTPAEIVGKSPRVLRSNYQNEAVYQEFWDTITSGTNWEGEFKNKKKNGEFYWQQSRISPLINEEGTITHFIGVLEDITNKKKMIEDLVEAKEKAEESDRLKSAFLANMSHEIRTPMNGIIGFTDLLKEQKLTGNEKDKYINIIKKSSERMINTINDLIEISQIESGIIHIETGDININEQMDVFYHQFLREARTKGLKFNSHKGLPDSLAMIETDGKKLNAIFTNLLKNAIKYTPEGNIDFGYKLKKNTIEFFVQDTGIGIASDRQKIIFDRFVQADMSMTKPYEGAGLGLSIAKAYVEMMGGKIWLESKPTSGTKFFFTIPFRGKSSQPPKVTSKLNFLQQEDVLKDLTILVVEDDVIGRIYLSELLHDSSEKVLFASDGFEALQLFRNHSGKIDIVLMDMKMPGMNGFETTRKMKEFNNEVFIIAQTAYALAGDREKAFDSGCDYYLAKPFNKSQLLDAIQQYYQ